MEMIYTDDRCCAVLLCFIISLTLITHFQHLSVPCDILTPSTDYGTTDYGTTDYGTTDYGTTD